MSEAIALGLGNNVDYEIRWDSKVIESLVRSYDISTADLKPVRQISTMKNLISSILGYVKSGIGTERYVEDPAIISDFASKFSTRITIGGTAARAAIALGRIGIPSAVHLVTTNDHVRRLMPNDGSLFCSNTSDSQYPHLIVQYEKGARVTAADIDITAPVSTRLIYVNDDDNAVLRLDPTFFRSVRGAAALLISGFNAMHDEPLLRARLRDLSDLLRAFSDKTTVFYEDACFHTAHFSRIVREALSPHLDVHSLNEDEMQGYLRSEIDLLDPQGILESLRALRAVIPVRTLVIHSRYWALATGLRCADFSTALTHGIAMAATRFRRGDDFSAEDFEATLHMPPDGRGAAFSDELNRLGGGEVCCRPSVSVDQENATTIGLGDAFVGGFLSTLADVQN